MVGRPWKVLSGDAHPELAYDLAGELGVAVEAAHVTRFADGEASVWIEADVHDAVVHVVQPTCPPVAENLMTLALMIDAAKAAGAARVVAIVPYFGYARQEERSRIGEPRGAQVASRLLAAVGLDDLITLDLHVSALESAFPMPLTHVRAEDVFVPEVKTWGLEHLTVVAPDAGGLKRAQHFAAALDAEVAVVTKGRSRPDVARPLEVLGDVRDRACLIVDDLASTGRTLAGASEVLHAAGAREIHAVFTHAVMAEGALDRLLGASLERIVTSDSIQPPTHDRLHVVRTAPQLAHAVRGLLPAAGELTWATGH